MKTTRIIKAGCLKLAILLIISYLPIMMAPVQAETVILPSGNQTIGENGVYQLCADYSGTISISPAVTEVKITDTVYKTVHTDTCIVAAWGREAALELTIEDIEMIAPTDHAAIDFGDAGSYENRLYISGTCDVTGDSAGVMVPDGVRLTIDKAEGLDDAGARLTATGGSYAAGIGGGASGSGGTITINGGTVTATGGLQAAGIGGGASGSDGTITINGGTVTATGGSYAAGIGGGASGSGGTVTINGGTVTATGGSYAAGIGGGISGSVGTITINSGAVTAEGGHFGAAGIGGGVSGSGGTITINGGAVTAEGGQDGGAGIGSGDSCLSEDGAISIYGGTVIANGSVSGAGIGGGRMANFGVVVIQGGMVTATGGEYAAGIGGGELSKNGTVVVTGTPLIIATGNTLNGAEHIGKGTDGDTVTLKDGFDTDLSYLRFSISGGAGAEVKLEGISEGYAVNNSGITGTLVPRSGSVTYTASKAGYAALRATQVPSEINHQINIALTADNTPSALTSVTPSVLRLGDETVEVSFSDDYGIYGTLYLVPKAGAPYADKAALNGAIIKKTLNVESPAESAVIDTTGLEERYYQAYLVDSAENLSAPVDILIDNVDDVFMMMSGDFTIGENGGYELCEDYAGIITIADNVTNVKVTDTAYQNNHDNTAIFVSGGRTEALSLTIEDIRMTAPLCKSAIDFQYAGYYENRLYLGGTCNVTGYAGSGIHVPEGTRLIIDKAGGLDDAGAELMVTGGLDGAGIGGYMAAGGTITINGGTITTTGGFNGAGIGGGASGAGGNITINGGTITATGDAGAGIGGGNSGAGGNITINGGTVTATGGIGGAGIGGGISGAGGTVTITGTPMVIATRDLLEDTEHIGKGMDGSNSGTLKNVSGENLSYLRFATSGIAGAKISLEGVSGESTTSEQGLIGLFVPRNLGTVAYRVKTAGYEFVHDTREITEMTLDINVPMIVENTPPIATDGTISISGVASTAVNLFWNKASDNKTDEADLEYCVYQSNTNSMDTVVDIEANGTVKADYVADVDSVTITGLQPDTTYTFNIIVRDLSNNKTCYAKAIVTTNPRLSGGGTAPATTVDAYGNITARPQLNYYTGVAKTTINAGMLDSALSRTSANSDGKRTVEIAIPAAGDAKAYETTLPAGTLTSSGSDTFFSIRTTVASVTLPGNMLAREDAGNSISLTIEGLDASSISNVEARSQIGDRPVIRLSLEMDGQPFAWRNENAPVTVSIPYTPTGEELEDPEHIVIWYIDGQGNVIQVHNGRYDPISGSVTFTTTHFSHFVIAYHKKTFNDLDDVAWAKKPVEVLASKGVLWQPSEEVYYPRAEITRAEFLYGLMRALNIDAVTEDNFTDIQEEAYYYRETAVAKKLGIAAGIGNQRFGPEQGISRQDMMVMADRALDILDDKRPAGTLADLDKFSDAYLAADYATGGIAWFVGEGLVIGGNGRIYPRDIATRAQAAVILYKLYTMQ